MSSKPQEQQDSKPEAQAPQLNGLEEDDEFEEFAAQGTPFPVHSLRKHGNETKGTPCKHCARFDSRYVPATKYLTCTHCSMHLISVIFTSMKVIPRSTASILAEDLNTNQFPLLVLHLTVDWNEAEEEKDAHQWDDNWDDDDVEDDFSQQLR